ncbi:MAG: prepilin-type N-terminal cleavage/methylation domain-containing protein [Deltaproteobacteria bacterium]|nr:prepilin-type N-terminal cleavage/methylation domain-containing protein [Deltaproteobacteria bacterium]
MRRRSTEPRAGFTLLEVMMALLLLATSIMILVQSQLTAVHLQEEATRINTATMLARGIFTELEFRMFDEGFGELEVKEQGDFNDTIYDGQFDEYRWEYEVEKVDVELPGLGNLMQMLGGGQEEAGQAVGLNANAGQGPGGQLAALGQLGILSPEMLSEQMSNYLREARVRICWTPGQGGPRNNVEEECLEVISHLSNPTGKVLSAEEQEQLDLLEDAQGTEAAEQALDNLNRPSR